MRFLIVFEFILLFAPLLSAKGVIAGTIIKNRAKLNFTIEGKKHIIKSNLAKVIVAQLIEPKVSWVDTVPVLVKDRDKKRVLTFKVLNSGNGKDTFLLEADEVKYKSNFNLSNIEIFRDTNRDMKFDIEDRRVTKISLMPDKTSTIFVVCDIGSKKELNSDKFQSFVKLKAISKLGGSGKKGHVNSKKNNNKIVVDGINGGIDEDEGIFDIALTDINTKKSAMIDKKGIITVTIYLSVLGKNSINNVKVKDFLPKNTKYIQNSLMVDNNLLTINKNRCSGYFTDGKNGNKPYIVINFNHIDVSEHHTIKYNLKIKEKEENT